MESQLQTVKEVNQELELKIQLSRRQNTETTSKKKEPQKIYKKKQNKKKKNTIEEWFKEMAGYKAEGRRKIHGNHQKN